MTRRPVRSFGAYGYTVHLFLEDGRVVCEWRDSRKKRHTKSWPDNQREAAERWAEAYADERKKLTRVAGPIPTILELWEAYKDAKADGWRPKTLKLYGDWLAMLAPLTKPCDEIEHGDIDTLRKALRRRGIAHSSIRKVVGFLRQLLNFAQGRRLIIVNPIATYRYETPKDEREKPPAEYTRRELVKIAKALDWPSQWRPRNVLRLSASYGTRVNALLHLRWPDVDFTKGTVTFLAKWDKNGETFTRPMTKLARVALREAYKHRDKSGWVFWSQRRPGRPVSYSGIHWHLGLAEKRAGVRHIPKRAFHGLRRMVVGDIGDVEHAAQWLNHKTLAITNDYVRERPETLKQARLRLERREASGN